MFGEKPLNIRVLSVKENVKKDEARELYELI